MPKTPAHKSKGRSRTGETSPRALVAPRATLRGPDILTRADVARLLDCTIGGVRKMQARGELVSELVGGVHYFRRATVVAHKMTKASTSAIRRRTVDGELAAAIFTALDARKSPIEIVREYSIAPATLRELIASYDEFAARPKSSTAERQPSRDDDSAAVTCVSCDEQPARYCAGCSSAAATATKPARRPASTPSERTTSAE